MPDRGIDQRGVVLDGGVGHDGQPVRLAGVLATAQIAIEHPGPTPGITTQAIRQRLSPVARRLLFRRGWHGTIALVLAVIPAGLSFSVDLPPLGRSYFFVAAVVLYGLVRLILRATVDTAPFVVREYECRRLWELTLAEWEAKAGPRRFEDKRRELWKLKDWWDEAASQPQQRARIEAAIRRAFDDLQQIVGQIQFARMSLRENAEETYERLLQTQLDLAGGPEEHKKRRQRPRAQPDRFANRID